MYLKSHRRSACPPYPASARSVYHQPPKDLLPVGEHSPFLVGIYENAVCSPVGSV